MALKSCPTRTVPFHRNLRPPSKQHLFITFGRPPTVGGATLQSGLTEWHARAKHLVAFYWRSSWTVHDEKCLSTEIGDCASQAWWEAYALLLLCVKWLPILEQCNFVVHFVGDALGVLCDALQFRARGPKLGRMMGE